MEKETKCLERPNPEGANLSKQEREFIKLLSMGISDSVSKFSPNMLEMSMNELMTFSKDHKVSAHIYRVFEENGYPDFCDPLKNATWLTLARNEKLFEVTKDVMSMLKNEGIETALLKGPMVARFYPMSSYRMSSDVDLLLQNPKLYDEAISVLEENGLTIKECDVKSHHAVFFYEGKIVVELHSKIVEPFDEVWVNKIVDRVFTKTEGLTAIYEINGEPIVGLSEPYFLFSIFLHMLQHFLRAGMGLKFIADFTRILQGDFSKESKDTFLELVDEIKAQGFLKTVTSACVTYFMLPMERADWILQGKLQDTQAFVKDLMLSLAFGNKKQGNLVTAGSGSIWGYVKAFHNAMRANYPIGSKVFLLWPFLWIGTLVRFLTNNRKERNVPVKLVLETTKRRSRLIADMKLWK